MQAQGCPESCVWAVPGIPHGAGPWWHHPRCLRRVNPWAERLGLHRSSPKLWASSCPHGTAGAANKFFLWLSQDWSLPLPPCQVGFVEFPPFQVLPPNPHPAAAWEQPVNSKKGIFLQREEFPGETQPCSSPCCSPGRAGCLRDTQQPQGIRNQGILCSGLVISQLKHIPGLEPSSGLV